MLLRAVTFSIMLLIAGCGCGSDTISARQSPLLGKWTAAMVPNDTPYWKELSFDADGTVTGSFVVVKEWSVSGDELTFSQAGGASTTFKFGVSEHYLWLGYWDVHAELVVIHYDRDLSGNE